MKSVTIKKEWYEILTRCKSVNIPLVLDAVFRYAFFDEEVKLPPTEWMAVEFIKIDIDRQKAYSLVEEVKQLRTSKEYRDWRKAVLQRDKYTCMHCGLHNDDTELNAHHIKPFSIYPELRFDIDNGLTLCRNCHINVHKTEREWERM